MSDSESDTPIRTISNGHHYTDSYGKGTLPILADESGFLPAQPMERASDAPPDKCDCCSIEGKNASGEGASLHSLLFPCIIRQSFAYDRSRTSQLMPCITPGGESGLSSVVARYVRFQMCDRCSFRSCSVMDVSDHLTSGHDWWNMVNSLRELINDEPMWQKWAGGAEILARTAAKKMCVLEQGVNGENQPGLFSKIPHDILYLIAPYVKQNELNRFATKIQALYRGWKVRMFSPSNEWHRYLLNSNTLADASRRNLWTFCDDCGMLRSVKHMRIVAGCADGNCCPKVVCKCVCCYKCPSCRMDNFIQFRDKRCDGTDTFFTCFCGTSFLIYEEWFGMSIPEFEQLYGNV